MFDKMKYLFIIWLAVTFAYIFMALTHSTWDTFADNASSQMDTQNMTGIYGIQEAIDSSNYWKWVIPALVGMVSSVIVLREEIINRVMND